MKKNEKQKMGNPAAVAAASAASKAGPAANKVNKDTKGALSWVAVAGASVGVILIYQIFKNIGKAANVVGSVADAASGVLDGFTDGMTNPEDATNTPISITNAQAKTKATILLEAMGGAGTDFERIKDALTGVTKADYVLIASEFGTPRYGVFGQAPWPAPERNLSYWLATELSNSELDQIRQMIPGIF